MKKIISIIAILFCFATLYAQDTKPTKQETMDWIASKMKENLNKKYVIFHPYANGIFEFSESIKEYDPEEGREVLYYITRYIDLNKVTAANYCVPEQGSTITVGVVIEGSNLMTIKKVKYLNDEVIYTQYEKSVGLGGNFYPCSSDFFDTLGGLIERVRKAITNLAEYNTQKSSNEAY